MENKRSPEDVFLEMTELFAELGWFLAMEEGLDGTIKGVIVGTGEYVAETLENLPNGDDYSIYQHGVDVEKGVH